MFDRVSIELQDPFSAGNPINMGALAESLLFYDDVSVVVDRAGLHQLIRAFSPETLLEYLGQGHIRLEYEGWGPAVHTQMAGTPGERHLLTTFEIEGSDLLTQLRRSLHEITGRTGRARRLALKLAPLISSIPHDTQLHVRMREEASSPEYIEEASLTVLSRLIPGLVLPAGTYFRTALNENRLTVDTNLHFVSVNDLYHRLVPVTHSSVSPAFLLSHIVRARKMLENASRTGSELATNAVFSDLIGLKIAGIVRRRDASERQIGIFQDFVFDDSRAVAEAISSGERTFADLLPVLEKAERFRSWIRNQPPDTSLLKGYVRAATEQTWVDRIPGKVARWSIFTSVGLGLDLAGAGGAGTSAGLLLSAGDQFLLDRLLKGWNPTQFINGPLRRFLNRQTDG